MPLPFCHIRKASGFGLPACLYYLDLLRKLANGGFWLTSTFSQLQKMLQCSGMHRPICYFQKFWAFQLTSTIWTFTKASALRLSYLILPFIDPVSFPAHLNHLQKAYAFTFCLYNLIFFKSLRPLLLAKLSVSSLHIPFSHSKGFHFSCFPSWAFLARVCHLVIQKASASPACQVESFRLGYSI